MSYYCTMHKCVVQNLDHSIFTSCQHPILCVGLLDDALWGGSCFANCHFHFTETPSSMLVSWVTFAPTAGSLVKYGLKGKSLTSSASGNMTKFEDSSVVRYMHVVEVKGLQPGEAYGGYACM